MASDVSLLELNAELMELASALGLAKPPDAESERVRANAPPPMMTRDNRGDQRRRLVVLLAGSLGHLAVETRLLGHLTLELLTGLGNLALELAGVSRLTELAAVVRV